MTDQVIPDASLGGGAIAPVYSVQTGSRSANNLSVGTGVVSVGSLLKASASLLVRSASRPQTTTVAGLNSLLPLVYGRQQVQAKIGAVLVSGNKLYLLCAWCVGEIDAIESVLIDGLVPAAGVALTHYTGTSSQGIDATLQAAFSGVGKVYADKLPNVAYSVVVIPSGTSSSFPTVLATIRGLKVPLTSGGTPTWTQNAAYCLADLIQHPTHGMGGNVDWADVATVAADCASSIGSPAETKRLLNIIIDQSQTADAWVTVLADYAGCFAVMEAGTYKLPLDAAGTTVWTFDASNIVEGSMQVSKKAALSQPTVVTVEFTDTTQTIYARQRVSAYATGVLSGAIPRMVSRIPKPGINRYSEANRYAIERLNQAQLSDVQIKFMAFDEGINVRAGGLIAVNHPIGFGPITGFAAGKPFRVLSINPVDAGRWQIAAAEYDQNQYSTIVATGPTTPDTVLQSPATPPTVTGLTVVEEVYQVQTGRYASRLRITWADASTSYPFAASYAVGLTQAGTSVEVATVSSASQTYVTGPLAENLLYVASVQVRSSIGALGTAATASLTNNGKLAKPSDVPSASGFEVGGQVRLSWVSATDLDLTATELRYGAVGVAWASATLLDRVATPSIRYATDVVPAGTWDFLFKGLDSVRSTTYPYGQESVTEARVTITVTSDAAAFVATSDTFASPLLSHMTAAAGGGWVTDFGDTWNSLFTSTLSTYTNDLATYHTAGTSAILTETFDTGASLTGDWYGAMTYSDLSGTAAFYIEVNNVGAESAKTITGATNVTPIVVTATGHGYTTGDEVLIAGVVGNTACNGVRTVTVIDANSFSLQDAFGTNVAGNGAYTGGGTAARWIWSKFQATTVKATARYARLRMTTTGTLLVTAAGTLRVTVVARQEGGTATTSASAATIVTFANRYNKAVAITGGLLGTAAGTWRYNNVEVDGGRGVAVGQALLFNGTSNYVDISDSVPLRITQPLTVEAYIKLTAITGAAQVIAMKDTETGTRYMWGLQIGIAGRLEAVSVANASSTTLDSLQPPAIGQWIHVAMTISGTTMTLFVDGIQQSSTTTAGTLSFPTGRMSIGSNPPLIGNPAHQNFFGGRIDDVRVWNVARTQAQIQANMNTPLLGTETGLVGYWKLDSLSGTVATDSTSNANNGTVSGAEWRPLNGVDLYGFDSTGAQAVETLSWNFSGV